MKLPTYNTVKYHESFLYKETTQLIHVMHAETFLDAEKQITEAHVLFPSAPILMSQWLVIWIIMF